MREGGFDCEYGDLRPAELADGRAVMVADNGRTAVGQVMDCVRAGEVFARWLRRDGRTRLMADPDVASDLKCEFERKRTAARKLLNVEMPDNYHL